jgi:glycosyltransferase involved in cell wall biosynthesis
VSKAVVTQLNFSSRLVRRVAHARSRFQAVQRYQGTGAALGVLFDRLGKSVSARTVRAVRQLSRPEDLVAVLPVRDLFMRHDVLFIGYLEAALGLGESMRGLVRSVAATGLPFALYPFKLGVEERLIGSFMADHYDLRHRHKINVIEMSTDQLPGNILRTYWELPRAPAEWAALLTGIREIWVPNEFVGTAFREIFDGPITIVPPCVEIETDREFAREQLGLDQDIFYFTFSFDYFSYPARKNPLGVVRAFQAAFPDPAEKVGLVIKSTSQSFHYLDLKAEILQAAQLDTRIKVVDHTFSRDEMLSLIRLSDCYISLHRSEGFGLGMAEAMAFGNPVIGTDYSGSTEFLSEATGFPVPYTMRPVGPGEYIFSDGQSWAEPDAAAAAVAMQRVFRDPQERQRRAAAGKAFVQKHYGRHNVGQIAAERLTKILRA